MNLVSTTIWHSTMHSLIAIARKQVRVEGTLLRIARLEAEKYEFLDSPELLVESLRAWRPRIDLFTFIQSVAEPTPKYAYAMEWDNLAALPISKYEHWWTHQINNKTRNMVRKADKAGVLFREVPFTTDLVRGIWTIYNECPVRQGRAFRHYGKSLKAVHRELATFLDSSIFLGAFLEDRLIGFAKLTGDDKRTQLGLMSIVSLMAERDKAPTNGLIAAAVRCCAERRISYLVYANFAYGNRQTDGLMEFKQNNGFQRIDVPRYYIPLTARGAIAYRLHLHQSLVHRLPESVLARIRRVRTKWYDEQLHSWRKRL